MKDFGEFDLFFYKIKKYRKNPCFIGKNLLYLYC